MPLISLKNADEAIVHLQRGDLVIYPTETAYALGADATNKRAVQKVFKVKKRAKCKSLPLIVGSLAMANKYGRFSAFLKRLAKKYWPGPLTIVAAAKNKVLSHVVERGDQTIALRSSSHRLARLLSRRLGRPLVSTSANLSGQKNIYSVRSLKKAFAKAPGAIYFLSGGTLPRRKSSTIVAFKNGKLMVLRRGSVVLRKQLFNKLSSR